jgi:hypothetical protein
MVLEDPNHNEIEVRVKNISGELFFDEGWYVIKDVYGILFGAWVTYVEQVVRLHGVPLSIVSDGDPIFTSRFWSAFQKALGTRLRMSTSHHPQTDGQSERTIQTLEDMLRACVLEDGVSWSNYLHLIVVTFRRIVGLTEA